MFASVVSKLAGCISTYCNTLSILLLHYCCTTYVASISERRVTVVYYCCTRRYHRYLYLYDSSINGIDINRVNLSRKHRNLATSSNLADWHRDVSSVCVLPTSAMRWLTTPVRWLTASWGQYFSCCHGATIAVRSALSDPRRIYINGAPSSSSVHIATIILILWTIEPRSHHQRQCQDGLPIGPAGADSIVSTQRRQPPERCSSRSPFKGAESAAVKHLRGSGKRLLNGRGPSPAVGDSARLRRTRNIRSRRRSARVSAARYFYYLRAFAIFWPCGGGGVRFVFSSPCGCAMPL